MSSNKNAKEELIRLYGAECFIEKLKLRQDSKPKRYKSKGQYKRMKQLTYHHILEKSKGGKATVQNGALLSAENHEWFHKQSREKQIYMNEAFQEYKKQYQECEVVLVDDLQLDFEVNPMTFHFDEKELKVEKYNRAKEKRELQKQIDDEMSR
jgi:hypothetical protein